MPHQAALVWTLGVTSGGENPLLIVDNRPDVSPRVGPGCYYATCLTACSVSSVGPDPPSIVWVQRTTTHVTPQLHLRVEGFGFATTPTVASRCFSVGTVRVATVVPQLLINNRTPRVIRTRIHLVPEPATARVQTTMVSRSTKRHVCRVERYRFDPHFLLHYLGII